MQSKHVLPLVLLIPLFLAACTAAPHTGDEKSATAETTPVVDDLLGDLQAGRQPAYPVQAYAKRIEGRVTATFDILEDGRVDNVSLTGCRLFFRETQSAMRYWRYPAGHPAMQQNTNFEFRLKNGGLVNPRPISTEKFGDDGCRQEQLP